MGVLADMRRDVSAVFERDPAARSKAEVALLYSGLHAVWAHRVSHACGPASITWPRGRCPRLRRGP